MTRPHSHAPAPSPLYLSGTPHYCGTCGRVISSRRPSQSPKSKYCSSRCKSRRPTAPDRLIESVFVAALSLDPSVVAAAADDAALQQRLLEVVQKHAKQCAGKKGDKRAVVRCSEVQNVVAPDSFQGAGGRGGPSSDEEQDGEENDGDGGDEGDTEGTREDAMISEGGDGVTADQARRREGMMRARQKERVKQAARRLVVFGWSRPGDDGPKRVCEALVNGRIVEPSFAKGDWAVRWRDG